MSEFDIAGSQDLDVIDDAMGGRLSADEAHRVLRDICALSTQMADIAARAQGNPEILGTLDGLADIIQAMVQAVRPSLRGVS